MNRLLRTMNKLLNALRLRRDALGVRKYDQFLFLGYNCELAYRFYRSNGFLDSSLFAWSLVDSVEQLVFALRHFDKLCTGDIVYDEDVSLYRCQQTGVCFHGRESMTKWMKKEERSEGILRDLTDLRGRVGYLKEKFLRYLRNDASTLAVLKIDTAACRDGSIWEPLRTLKQTLGELGARNVDVLVICEESARGLIFECCRDLGFALRSVRLFNPGSDACSEKHGDTAGWNRIWLEFAPAHFGVKKHRFKFEK